MENIKKLFSPTTKYGRAFRTFLQGFLAILTFAIGFLSIPGLEQFLIDQGVVAQAGTLGLWIGVVSYLWNLIEGFFKWLYPSES